MIKVGDLIKYCSADGETGIAVVVNIRNIYFDLKWMYVSNPARRWMNNDAVEKGYHIEDCFNWNEQNGWNGWSKLS